MKKMWKSDLEKIKPYIPGKPIEEVKRELGLEEVYKLASNESPMPPSPRVVEIICREASNVNRYPDGGGFYLKNKISERLRVPVDNIILGNGSDEVIMMAVRAFISPGDEVLTADPTFLMYGITSLIEGAVIKQVPMKGMLYDIDGMISAITDKTKIIFIANPNNPTGSYINKDDMERLIDKVPKDVVLFLDEAYYEFAAGGDYPETLGYLGKNKNIIITRTFSKAYGLAGLRVGYGVAGEEIIRIMDKIRDPFNVNSLAQAAAIVALEDMDYMEGVKQLVLREKERYYGFFDENSLDHIKSKTNFVLFKAKNRSDEIAGKLLKAGVIVREMTAWGMDGYIRVNMGLPEENDKFFEEFKRLI